MIRKGTLYGKLSSNTQKSSPRYSCPRTRSAASSVRVLHFITSGPADCRSCTDRLEASRKYLFGSLGVLGTSNDSLIEGVLIARGSDIVPVVRVAPDWESYSYEKVDLNNPEQKAYFEAALAWDLEVGGKKWADGKNVRILPYFGPLLGCLRLHYTVQVNKMRPVQPIALHATLCLCCCINTFTSEIQSFAAALLRYGL